MATSTFQCHRTHEVSDSVAGPVQHLPMARGQSKDNTDLPVLTRWEIENYLSLSLQDEKSESESEPLKQGKGHDILY